MQLTVGWPKTCLSRNNYSAYSGVNDKTMQAYPEYAEESRNNYSAYSGVNISGWVGNRKKAVVSRNNYSAYSGVNANRVLLLLSILVSK